MTVWDLALRARSDPLIGYALLGAAVLLTASLLGGLARGDVRALIRPRPWLALAAALAAALTLTAAGERLDTMFGLKASFAAVRRLPLHLLAIGYGPSLGLLAGLAFAVVESGQVALRGAGAVLALELAAVGWIALGPSPRRYRLAAPLAVTLGWALASATLGLAFWVADGRPSDATRFLATQASVSFGVAFSALVATVPTAAWWRNAAPGAAAGVRLEPDHDRVRWIRPLQRPRRGRPRRRMSRPPTPSPLLRQPAAASRTAAPPERGRS